MVLCWAKVSWLYALYGLVNVKMTYAQDKYSTKYHQLHLKIVQDNTRISSNVRDKFTQLQLRILFESFSSAYRPYCPKEIRIQKRDVNYSKGATISFYGQNTIHHKPHKIYGITGNTIQMLPREKMDVLNIGWTLHYLFYSLPSLREDSQTIVKCSCC